MSRPEYIKHYTEIQNDKPGMYPGTDEPLCISASFGRFYEFQRLGIHHELLKPGRRTSYPHAESYEEEFIYVLEGAPDVWIDGELHRLKPGDGVGFIPGTGICHTFLNNTDQDVRLLVVGDTSKKENKIYYPLNLERKERVGDAWWHDWPVRQLGSHDGKAKV